MEHSTDRVEQGVSDLRALEPQLEHGCGRVETPGGAGSCRALQLELKRVGAGLADVLNVVTREHGVVEPDGSSARVYAE